MQPPSVKTECGHLKMKFAEHLSKLQQKRDQDTELLQEIRSFSKQRASIERDYGQALQKLTFHFQERDWQKRNLDPDNTGVFEVWRSLLENTAKSAAFRLAAAGDYRKLIEDICYSLRNAKDTQVKSSLKDLQNIQREVIASVKELNESKKKYLHFYHIANVARGKAADAQKRGRKCENGVFHFKSAQNKTTAKLCTKLKELEERMIESRNEYLLTLAAVNSHHCHYYTEDLPRVIQQIDGDIYDSLRSHLSVLCGTEMEMCLMIHKQYNSTWGGVIKLTRETYIQHFEQDSDVFKKTTEFIFQPAPQDQVCVLQDICVSEEDGCLSKEAKKWMAKASNDYQMAAHGGRVLKTLKRRAKTRTGDAAQKLELKIADIQSSIRKTKVSRVKAEARLDLLAQSVEVTGRWADSVRTQADQGLNRDERLTNRRRSPEEFSFSDGDGLDLIYFEEEDGRAGDFSSDPVMTSAVCLCPAIGLLSYSYEANPSSEGEELQELVNGPMEDSLKVLNSCGQVGHILEHYVNFLCLPAEDNIQLDTSLCSSKTGLQEGAVKQVPRSDAARAVYTYQAQNAEELSSQDGALIQTTREVDDEFWEGEQNGRFGVFPSVLVELICDEEKEEEETDNLCSPPTVLSTDLKGEKQVVNEIDLSERHSDAEENVDNFPAPGRSQLRPCRPPPPPPKQAQSSQTETESKT